jgi:hypothetical protein
LLPGQSLLHYEILDEFGDGGMGGFYKTGDARLGRLAAI